MKKLFIIFLLFSSSILLGQEKKLRTRHYKEKNFVLIIKNNSKFDVKIFFDNELVSIVGRGFPINRLKTSVGLSSFRAVYYELDPEQNFFSYQAYYKLKGEKLPKIIGDGKKIGNKYVLNNKVAYFKDTVEIIMPDIIIPEITSSPF